MSGKHRIGVPVTENPFDSPKLDTADTVDVPRWTPESDTPTQPWTMSDSLPDPTRPPTDPPTDPPAAPEPPPAPQEPQYSTPRLASDPWRFASTPNTSSREDH